MMKRGINQGYFPKQAKFLFIFHAPGQEEAAKREFAVEGLTLNLVCGSRYLGVYLGPQEELEAWIKLKVEAWSHRFIVLGKIS